MLRNGTYIRERDGANLLYYSWMNWNDTDEALCNDKNLKDFEIVWDEVERAQLYQALGMSNLRPGEWVEIIGGEVV